MIISNMRHFHASKSSTEHSVKGAGNEELELQVLKKLARKNLEEINAQKFETAIVSKRVNELTRKLNNLVTKCDVMEKSNSLLHKNLFKTQDELESLQNTVFKNLYPDDPDDKSDSDRSHSSFDSPRHNNEGDVFPDQVQDSPREYVPKEHDSSLVY